MCQLRNKMKTTTAITKRQNFEKIEKQSQKFIFYKAVYIKEKNKTNK